jgi:hypothetical protein
MRKYSFEPLVHSFYICDWGLFLLRQETSGQNTYLWMQMVCSDPSSPDFLYSVEVANEDKSQSATYKGPVTPLCEVTTGQQEPARLVLTNQLLSALNLKYQFCIEVFIWQA